MPLDSFSSAGISISTLKWPELQTIAPSFIFSKCSCAMTVLLPVTVTKMSPILAASFMGITRKPSITASMALVGSISVTMTSAPMTLGAHGDAASAPAVAGDDHFEAGEQQVGGANDAVERGLAGAVAIVEEVLGQRVVDGDDRELQRAVLGHGAQANHAGGGFFGAADDVREQIGALGEQLVTRSAPSSMVICGLWSSAALMCE